MGEPLSAIAEEEAARGSPWTPWLGRGGSRRRRGSMTRQSLDSRVSLWYRMDVLRARLRLQHVQKNAGGERDSVKSRAKPSQARATLLR